MKFAPIPFASLLTLLLVPGVAVSQAPQPANLTPPTDPNAPVPTMQFRSVFRDSPKGVVTDTLDWKKANSDVGRFSRGHVDVLKWENTQSPATGAPATVEPAQPMKH